MNEKIPLRFFLITFLWSWLLWLPFVLESLGFISINANVRSSTLMPALFLGAFGPAVGACYSVWTLKGKSELGVFLKSFMSVRFGWKVWLSIFGILGGVNIIAWYIPELFGHDRLLMLLPTIYVFPAVWLFMIFLGGGQEEIGWRGYIMPLIESKYGYCIGSIILGVVWSCWHIPLWFIPGTNQVYMPFIAFLIGHVGLSFFLSWIIRASDKKPLAGLIAHGTSNALISILPTFIVDVNAFQLRFWIHQILLLIVGVLIIVALKRRLASH